MLEPLGRATWDVLDSALGLSLKSEQLGFGHFALRALLMYVILIVIVRSGKKRFLSRATAFDAILVIMLGSIAARALTGGAPFFPATLALVVLVALHWLFSALGRDWPWFSGLIKGHTTLLIENGRINHAALKDAHMSKDDLDEDLREKGIAHSSEVKEARLERSGKLSVIEK